ncbi:MAG: hypothetical protein QXN33_04550 [Candidatus Bathyarchaeia archaeon]
MDRGRKDGREGSGADLWDILVETVHSLPMYKYHKRYISEQIIPERPDITPEELAAELDIPLGEAIVIKAELDKERG